MGQPLYFQRCPSCGNAHHAPCRSCPGGAPVYVRREKRVDWKPALEYLAAWALVLGAAAFLINLALAASVAVWRMAMP